MPKDSGRKRPKSRKNWLARQLAKRPKPAWTVAVAHVLALGLALLLYALPHHVLPSAQQDTGIVSSRSSIHREAAADTQSDAGVAHFDGVDAFDEDNAPAEDNVSGAGDAPGEGDAPGVDSVSGVDSEGDGFDAPDEDDDGEPLPEGEDYELAEDFEDSETFGAVGATPADAAAQASPQAAEDPVGSFRNRFADKFTDGEVIETKNSYRSANLNVTFQKKYFDELSSRVYFVDIYVADISCLRTAFGEDTYGRGYKEWITKVAKRVKSVATMNGDYYGSRGIGVVVRNGKLYRDKKNIRDVAVLYWDGRFECVPPEKFDAKTAMANGAYQCWHFGPRLLDDEGRAMTKFNADKGMLKRQPRSAFGYFEPGHYCFVVVDGRHQESWGVKMTDLSALMEGIGCKAAYNLDGGQTSLLAKGTKLVNRPSGGGRGASDFIVVIDEVVD